MSRDDESNGRRRHLHGLTRLLGAVVRYLTRLAFVALLGIAMIASLLARGEFSALDGVITALLAAPPAILLLSAAGLREVMRLPERLRRMPQQGAEQLAELTRLAGDARTAGYGAPSVLWRLHSLLGSTRDLVGVSVPLRVFTPQFLGLTTLAVTLSVLLVLAGLVALVVLAVG